MRHLMVGLLIGTLGLLGLAGAGEAQPPAAVSIQGIVRAVDCQAHLLVLETGGRVNTFTVTPAAVVFANGTSIGFCTLGQFLGATATVWLGASNNEFVVGRVDLQAAPAVPPAYPAPPAAAPPAYAPYPPAPAPDTTVAPFLTGVVLGTILWGGLSYLLVHGPYGYFRYPYYGPYYRYYYRPGYAPYYGPYRYAPAYGWCNNRWSMGCR